MLWEGGVSMKKDGLGINFVFKDKIRQKGFVSELFILLN